MSTAAQYLYTFAESDRDSEENDPQSFRKQNENDQHGILLVGAPKVDELL